MENLHRNGGYKAVNIALEQRNWLIGYRIEEELKAEIETQKAMFYLKQQNNKENS